MPAIRAFIIFQNITSITLLERSISENANLVPRASCLFLYTDSGEDIFAATVYKKGKKPWEWGCENSFYHKRSVSKVKKWQIFSIFETTTRKHPMIKNYWLPAKRGDLDGKVSAVGNITQEVLRLWLQEINYLLAKRCARKISGSDAKFGVLRENELIL